MYKYLLAFFWLSTSLFAESGVTKEIFSDIPGHNILSILESSKYPWNPDSTDILTDFDTGKNLGDNYGGRVRAYVIVPETSIYNFYLSCDDYGQLYISENGKAESKQLYAYVNGWTGYKVWDKYESQKSTPVELTEGQVLYIEGFWKEGSGGDHFSVAWSKNGGDIEVITNEYLTAFEYSHEEYLALLQNAISLAESLYDQSSSNTGDQLGQYSEASRVNFSLAIETAQSIANETSSTGKDLAKSLDDLETAAVLFTGGIKPGKLRGVPFGSTPAWYSDRSFHNAFDGNIDTFFDYLINNGGVVGVDLGQGNSTPLLGVRYIARYKHTKRMVGGKIQGSINGLDYTDLYTITEEPSPDWQEITISDATSYRYFRYSSPNGSHCNIAELEFLGLQKQDLYMLVNDDNIVKANVLDQVLSKDNIIAEHGGLPHRFITYKILVLPEPSAGTLKLNGTDLQVGATYTQEDINNGLLTYSENGSKNSSFFIAEVSDTVGGLLEEVTFNIKVDSDNDGLTDLFEESIGSDANNADSNNNGLDDGWEYENGLNPIDNKLTGQVDSINGEKGLSAQYVYGRYSKISDFSSLSPAKVSKVSQINFGNSYWGEFANSGKVHDVGAKFSGYIDIPIEGNYKFIISSDDGSKLYIDDILVASNDGLHSYKQVSGVVNLSSGFHKIRVEYFEAGGHHGCILEWEGPGISRQVVPTSRFYLSLTEHQALEEAIDTDQDGLTDILEAIALTDPNNPDSDGDKLLDGEEYHAQYGYKTNPLSVDTDQDTVSDWDEIFVFKSNPLVPDFDGNSLEIINIKPKDVFSTTGKWQSLHDDIFSVSRRGGLEYEYELSQPGIYKLDIAAVANIMNSKRPFYDLQIYVDDEYVGRLEQTIIADETKNYSFLLPYSSIGKHKLKIYWDNVYENKSLQVISIELKKYGGPDNNENGRPDWVDNYLQNTYSLDEFSTSSKISPAQIEGRGRYLSKISNSLSLPVKKGTYRRWYLDLDLNQEGPTPFTLEFENGLDSKSGNITWQETNVLDEGELVIPIGSSLKLNAVINGDLEPNVTLKVGSDESVSVSPENPLVYKFDTQGTFEIVADYQGSQNLQKTLSVKVVGVSTINSPFIWRGKTRFWSWSGLDESIILQAEGMEFTPTVGGYNLRRSEVLEDVNIIARLGANGPILHSLETKAFWIRDAVDGYLNIIEKYEDGSIETLGKVFSYQIPEGMNIQVNTISGVTFLDGSRKTIITKDDFNEFGEWDLRLLRSPDRTGANCHWYKVYQDGILIGQQNK